MRIEKNTIVAIDYTLKDDDGQVLDSSDGREPLTYLHGVGGLIPGLEQELAGKQAGDQLQIAVAPADGYVSATRRCSRRFRVANSRGSRSLS